MSQNEILMLKGIYERILEKNIDLNTFMEGDLIERFHIDSLLALQIIVEIEKSFNVIIEDDDKAIKIVESPSVFLDTYKGSNCDE